MESLVDSLQRENNQMRCVTEKELESGMTANDFSKYQEVKVVQDDDGHTYVISSEDYERWSKWYESDDIYSDEFNNEMNYFNSFQTSGDLNLKLYAKVGYQNDSEF